MDAITIALYASEESTRPEVATETWDTLCAALSTHERGDCTLATCVQHRVAALREKGVDIRREPHKSDPQFDDLRHASREGCAAKLGSAWSPVRMLPGARRGNAGVQAVTLAVFDLDHVTQTQLEAVAERLEGYACLLHSTHSHRPPHDQCLRLVMPLARPVSPGEWASVRAAAIAHFGLPADRAASDPARLFFFPRAPQDAPVFAASSSGRPLDPDLLRPPGGLTQNMPKKAPSVESGAFSEPSRPDPAIGGENASESLYEPLSLNALLADLKATRRSYRAKGREELADLLGRVLDGEPLAEPGARDNTVNRAASILGARLPTTAPWDAAREILRPSIARMDTEPEGLDYWLDCAESSFVRAQKRRVERDQKTEEINQAIRRTSQTRLTQMLEAKQRGELGAPVETDDDESAEAQPVAQEDDLAWAHLLQLKPVKDPDETPQLLKTAHNLLVFLTHHPDWRGVLRFNELTKTIEVTGGPLAPEDRHLSTLSTAVCAWLSREVGIEWNEPQVKSAILLAARRRSYDPLLEYMSSLRWDGVTRLETFLEEFAGVMTTDLRGNDISQHVRKVSAKFLVSAAARALEPGCKVDTVLVLEGLTGKGKSEFFAALGGDFFAASQINLGDKDSMLLVACKWLVELAELDAIRGRKREAVNAFLTTRVDNFRVPYGSAIETFPRRAVFVGTSEDDDYLSSHKGARRWLPVRVGKQIDPVKVRAVRDQVWAEACVRARRALAAVARSEDPRPEDRWWFRDEEFEEALKHAEERVRVPPQTSAIAAWWFRKVPEQRPGFVTALDVAQSALGVTVDKMDHRVETVVADAMYFLGFRPARNTLHGVQLPGFEASERLLTARATPTGSVVSMLRGGGVDIPAESGENTRTSR